MIGNLAMYVANRATGGAVDNLARRASWSVVGAAFCVCASVFGIVALFWALTMRFSPIASASIIAVVSLVIGLICLATPSLIEWSEKQRVLREKAGVSPLTATIESANKETAAVVDYFGPLQVVASAFLLGMRTGQQVLGPKKT